ncbi:hypothetical protein GXP70_17970 [Paenibacillus lycopersici]|uniref:YprB ribonuclease H-like domain-containing protein n=1 Tax=Paenibacillus lycopersici TaxID=2704462 RepID=A0A6C0G1Y0_9BACL|nr:ribonuclease H-like domain-containing protein [Paenibacillus lycopersici]QHT61671.1 hypothetical protein GXP70_17970 [Paenibacillus lycopersici]
MSGLRDKLLRLRSAQAAQAERLAGMVETPAQAAEAGADGGAATGVSMSGARVVVEPQAQQVQAIESATADSPVGEGAGAFAGDMSASVDLAGSDEREDVLEPAWGEIGVRLVRTPEGDLLIRECRYPLAHRHGAHALEELLEAQPALSAFDEANAKQSKGVEAGRVSGDRAVREGMNMLFLDLETTGLGVGAGNVPFMVGLAYMQEETFVVEQILIRHPAEERAMIGYLSALLPRFTHLVTYNGRTFDCPVLYNRFVLHGYRSFDWQPVHIDLLHPSRSVWRNTLVSCKLSHVEEERLGIKRNDDVPGSLAPAIYFQYLADGNPEPLHGVFRHNEIDMLSLAALAIRFGHFLAGGVGSRLPLPEEAEELLRTGLWLERMGRTDLAEPLYARFAVHPRPTFKSLCLLAERDKKCGNWHRAVLLWQKAVLLASETARPGYEAHIELAMYYEHRTKELEQALQLAEQAFELAAMRHAGLRMDGKRRAELDVIRKRINRLQLKRSKG